MNHDLVAFLEVDRGTSLLAQSALPNAPVVADDSASRWGVRLQAAWNRLSGGLQAAKGGRTSVELANC